MNSERYNERLNQIREKYGRAINRNPEQGLRQLSHKREYTPLQAQPQSNKVFNNFEMPPKPTRKQGRTEGQTPVRRQKQNCPASPLSLIMNQSPLGRHFRQKQPIQLQENASKYCYEFPRSQRPSISQTYYRPDLSPRQSKPNIEYSSPIKKLQYQLQGQRAPMHYGNAIERYSIVTPNQSSINYSRPPQDPSDRSPISKPYAVRQAKQSEMAVRVSERAAISRNETVKENPKREQQSDAKQLNDEQQGGQGQRASFNLNSISKIQERIQCALNNNKK